MSMNLATFYRRIAVRPFSTFRQHAKGGPAHERSEKDAPHVAPCTDPERLERIANYARAGYFNMGYTLDMFQMIGEIAPA
jgi:hypothetical protein